MKNISETRIVILAMFMISTAVSLFINAISLPSWVSSIALVGVVTCVLLLMVIESMKAPIQDNPDDRRAILRQYLPSMLAIASLGILLSVDLLQQVELTREKGQLEQEQKAFRQERTSKLTRLRIGFLPRDTTASEPSIGYLEKSLTDQLGFPVKFQDSTAQSTYQDTVDTLGKGGTEAALIGPLSYIYASQKYGAQAILCRLTEEGSRTYRSYVIIKATTPIGSVQDLKGREFAYVDSLSTSGYLAPKHEFKQAGLDPDKDIHGYFSGSDEQVLNDVLSQKSFASAISSIYYNQAAKQGKTKDIRILKISSLDIPVGPIVLRKDIQRLDALNIEDAFLAMNEHPEILNTIGNAGFARARDKDYERIRELAKEMNII